MMPNVLVTGVCSDVGQGIGFCLKESDIDCRIVGTSVFTMGSGLYLFDAGYVVPYAEDPGFIPRIIDVCNKENIDLIFIGVDAELMTFSRNRELIENETNSRVLVSPPDVLDNFWDKYKTARYLEEKGLPFPRSILLHDVEATRQFCRSLGFPLILKPRRGRGARNVQLVNNWQDVAQFIGNDAYMLQEFLTSPEDEYTAGAYADRDGRLQRLLIQRRELRGGTTYRAIVRDHPEDQFEQVKTIASSLSLKGYFNLQMRKVEEHFVVFEVNPRFSGTVYMVQQFGFNGPDMAVREYLFGETFEPDFSYEPGIALRYWTQVFVSKGQNEKVGANLRIENSGG